MPSESQMCSGASVVPVFIPIIQKKVLQQMKETPPPHSSTLSVLISSSNPFKETVLTSSSTNIDDVWAANFTLTQQIESGGALTTLAKNYIPYLV